MLRDISQGVRGLSVSEPRDGSQRAEGYRSARGLVRVKLSRGSADRPERQAAASSRGLGAGCYRRFEGRPCRAYSYLSRLPRVWSPLQGCAPWALGKDRPAGACAAASALQAGRYKGGGKPLRMDQVIKRKRSQEATEISCGHSRAGGLALPPRTPCPKPL